MNRVVIDASTAAAAFFQEEHGREAQKILASRLELHAPDLIFAEFANVLWKRTNRKEIRDEEAVLLLNDFLRLPLHVTPSGDLAESALKLAVKTGRTVYDSLYLALALKLKTTMITDDKRLVNALQDGPLAASILWIGA